MANFLECNITKLRIGARTNGNYIPDVNSPELLVDGTANITTANINIGNIETINGKTINIKDTNSNNVLVMNATSFTAYDNITIDANNVDIDKVLRIKRNNSLQDINTIITNEREAAKSYADGKVSDEASARNTADTNLGNRITQEINDRSAAINQEVTDRNAAINSAKTILQGNIDAEAGARSSKDDDLQTQINRMNNGGWTNSLQQQINNIKNTFSSYATLSSALGASTSGNHFIMKLGSSNKYLEIEYGSKPLTSRNAKYSQSFSQSFTSTPMVFLTWKQNDSIESARECFATLRSVTSSSFEFSTSFSNNNISASNHAVQYLAISIW